MPNVAHYAHLGGLFFGAAREVIERAFEFFEIFEFFGQRIAEIGLTDVVGYSRAERRLKRLDMLTPRRLRAQVRA